MQLCNTFAIVYWRRNRKLQIKAKWNCTRETHKRAQARARSKTKEWDSRWKIPWPFVDYKYREREKKTPLLINSLYIYDWVAHTHRLPLLGAIPFVYGFFFSFFVHSHRWHGYLFSFLLVGCLLIWRAYGCTAHTYEGAPLRCYSQ